MADIELNSISIATNLTNICWVCKKMVTRVRRIRLYSNIQIDISLYPYHFSRTLPLTKRHVYNDWDDFMENIRLNEINSIQLLTLRS